MFCSIVLQTTLSLVLRW